MEEKYTKFTVTDIFTGESKEISSILQGYTVTESANDTMDSGMMIYIDPDPTPLKPFSLVRLPYKPSEEDSLYKELCVCQDNSVERVKMPGREDYKHHVTLIEKTAILEKIIVQNLMLTNAGDTLLVQLEKACKNALPGCLDNSTDARLNPIKITLSDSLKSRVGDCAGEDFGFDCANMKEILEEMLSPLGIRPVVSELIPGMTLEIAVDYEDPNGIYQYDAFKWRIGTETTNDIREFGGRISAYVNNALPTEPCVEKDIRAKAQGDIQNSDNLFLSVTHPIEDIKSVKATTAFNIQMEIDVDFGNGKTIGGEVYFDAKNIIFYDISEHFLDSEGYELLSEENKKLYVPYTRGEKLIDINKRKKYWIIETDQFLSIHKTALEKQDSEIVEYVKANIKIIKNNYANNFNIQYGFEGLDINYIIPYDWKVGKVDIGEITKPNLNETVYQISYIPRLDYLCDIIKPNCHNAKEAALAMFDGQTASSPDTRRLGTALLGKITRIGKDIVCVDDKAHLYSGLKPLKTCIDQKYIIYQRDMSIFDGFIKVRYYMTEGYNNYSVKVGIKREKRIYNIPVAGSECIINSKSYIYFGTTEPTCALPHLNTNALEKMANALIGKKGGEFADRVLVRTTGEQSKYFELPIAGYAGGNTFGFKSSFLDNYTSGYSYDSGDRDFFGKKAVFNPYCDKNGEFKEIQYALMSGRENKTAGVINALPKSAPSYYGENNKLTDERMFAYSKDRSQAISLQADFVLLADSASADKIIIGEKLAQSNGVFSKGIDNPYLYLSNRTYARNEIFRAKGERQLLALNGGIKRFVVEKGNSFVKLVYSSLNRKCSAWAIGDEQGNLLLAVNGALKNGDTVYISSDKVLF